MKNLNNLSGAAIGLIALAAIILAGIAVVGEYEDYLKSDTAVVNESTTISSGAATLANDEITLSTFLIQNSTGSIFINGNVSTSPTVNLTTGGSLTSSLVDGTYKSSYTYAADTDASGVAQNFSTGLAIFGAFVGVLAISLIGKVVISLFKKGM